MGIDIRLATTREELQAIFRFRYEEYVKEPGYGQAHADHESRRTVDPLDETAKIIGAFEDGQVVGTSRLNYARNSNLGYYDELYSLNRAGKFHPDHTSITTRLMISERFRGGTLSVSLAKAGYRMMHSEQIEFDFINCRKHLIEFFLRLGYRTYKGKVQHPDDGEMTPMVLALSDEKHLAQVNSPFLEICREFPTCKEAVSFSYSNILPSTLGAWSCLADC